MPMKKHIIIAVVAIALMGAFVPDVSAQSAAADMPVILPSPLCPTFGRSLGLGSRGNDVSMLQSSLRSEGYLSVAPTGYFGFMTRAAVVAYQRANGIPMVGIVGPMTRGHMQRRWCPKPKPDTTISVVSPKAGDTWRRGTVQKIAWQDSARYFVEQKYDIYVVQEKVCPPRMFCTLEMPLPMAIAKNVSLSATGYAWNVGDLLQDGAGVITAKYMVQVCLAGTQSCASSGAFDIFLPI